MRPAVAVFFVSALGLVQAVVTARSPCAGCSPSPFLAVADDAGTPVKINGLTATAPAGWVKGKPANRLRSHQFALPGKKDGPGDAELVVLPESNPDPKKMFPRWRGQFVPPDGKTADDLGTVGKLDGVKETAITLLDVTGTWNARTAPNDPKAKDDFREGYRVVWAIVAGKEEAAHVRLSGPKETVDAHYPAFEKWLKSLKPDQGLAPLATRRRPSGARAF